MVQLYLVCLVWFNAQDVSSAPAVLTAVVGDVRIIRQADSVEIAAHMLDHLFEGDSIITGDGRATVFFWSGTLRIIEQDQSMLLTLLDAHSGGTGGTAVHLEMETYSRLFQLADDDISILERLPAADDTCTFAIYAPGNTAVRTNRPNMLWSAVPEANWYAVTVEHNGRIIEDIATTDTFVPYPEQHDSLASGSYVLRICAFHSNDSICCLERIFRVLSDEEHEAIEKSVEDALAMSPESLTAQLLTAMAYEQHGLTAQAIEAYQKIMLRHHIPFVLRRLAVLHVTLGIPEYAKQYYDMYRASILQQ